MKEIFGIIYKTTCILNGKVYIGQTINWRDKQYLGSGVALSKAIKKYGKENFKRKILKICFNQKQLDAWEFIFIKKYNSINTKIGYNILTGTANNFGSINPSKIPEVKEKIKLKKRGKFSKENCYWYGKKLSDETKHKLSEKAKKRLSNPINNGMYGKKHSEETKAKIAEKSKGRIGYNRGKTLSKETRLKISESICNYYKTKLKGGNEDE